MSTKINPDAHFFIVPAEIKTLRHKTPPYLPIIRGIIFGAVGASLITKKSLVDDLSINNLSTYHDRLFSMAV